MATETTEEFSDQLQSQVTEALPSASATDEEETEALDELEAEELDMLTEDETSETLVIDEAAEMRAIRRAEIAMDVESVDEATPDEFVCTNCFLVKRSSQLANKRKRICRDCAS
jgi:hypothetical protein